MTSHTDRIHLPRGRGYALAGLFTAFEVWRQRQKLATLDAHLLEDIGLDAAKAHAEAARPIWDVPANWLR